MKTITKRMTGFGILLLMVVALTIIPQVSAMQTYSSALKTVYGNGSCSTCHVNPNGGNDLTAYGNKFMDQPNYSNEPETALKAIGTPPGMVGKKSPGFDIVIILGIISIIYVLMRK